MDWQSGKTPWLRQAPRKKNYVAVYAKKKTILHHWIKSDGAAKQLLNSTAVGLFDKTT